MPLKNTNILIEEFGQSLIDGTISDDSLDILLNTEKTFPKIPLIGYVDPSIVSDSNQSPARAMSDFVQTIGPLMSDEMLHKLTKRLIEKEPSNNSEQNRFMRDSTISKTFLAYEMVKSPKLAEEHFNSDRIKNEIKNKDAMGYFKGTILYPVQRYFESPIIVSEVSNVEENNKQKKIVEELLAICKEHKKIIKSCHNTDTYIQNKSGEFIPDVTTKLAKDRLVVITRYISHLKKAPADAALNEFKRDYNNTKEIFTKDNDSIGKLFVNAIMCVVTKGFKATFLMWKEGVNAIEETQKIDDLLSNNPKM